MTFDIAEKSAVALASVCRRLDGIALAIELAAPPGRMMSLQQSSKRIDDLRRADRRIAHATSLEIGDRRSISIRFRLMRAHLAGRNVD